MKWFGARSPARDGSRGCGLGRRCARSPRLCPCGGRAGLCTLCMAACVYLGVGAAGLDSYGGRSCVAASLDSAGTRFGRPRSRDLRLLPGRICVQSVTLQSRDRPRPDTGGLTTPRVLFFPPYHPRTSSHQYFPRSFLLDLWRSRASLCLFCVLHGDGRTPSRCTQLPPCQPSLHQTRLTRAPRRYESCFAQHCISGTRLSVFQKLEGQGEGCAGQRVRREFHLASRF